MATCLVAALLPREPTHSFKKGGITGKWCLAQKSNVAAALSHVLQMRVQGLILLHLLGTK